MDTERSFRVFSIDTPALANWTLILQRPLPSARIAYAAASASLLPTAASHVTVYTF